MKHENETTESTVAKWIAVILGALFLAFMIGLAFEPFTNEELEAMQKEQIDSLMFRRERKDGKQEPEPASEPNEALHAGNRSR